MPSIECPECGHDYIHIEAVDILQNRQEISIGYGMAGEGLIAPVLIHEIDESSGRGSVVDVRFFCENGHRFEHKYRFHKGNTDVSIVRLEGFDPGQGHTPELWRD